MSNYPNYKKTVIGETVKKVVIRNKTQSLTTRDEKQIKNKLHLYGIKVMDSYELTNPNNYGLGADASESNGKLGVK